MLMAAERRLAGLCRHFTRRFLLITGTKYTLMEGVSTIYAGGVARDDSRRGLPGAYFPLNTGLRFSMKARCASLVSSVCESATVTVCSKR